MSTLNYVMSFCKKFLDLHFQFSNSTFCFLSCTHLFPCLLIHSKPHETSSHINAHLINLILFTPLLLFKSHASYPLPSLLSFPFSSHFPSPSLHSSPLPSLDSSPSPLFTLSSPLSYCILAVHGGGHRPLKRRLIVHSRNIRAVIFHPKGPYTHIHSHVHVHMCSSTYDHMCVCPCVLKFTSVIIFYGI